MSHGVNTENDIYKPDMFQQSPDVQFTPSVFLPELPQMQTHGWKYDHSLHSCVLGNSR